MKILQVSGFPNNGAGSGTLMTTQAEGLIKKGHKVHTIISENKSDFPRVENNGYTMIPFTNSDEPEEIEGQLPFNFPMFTTHTRSKESFWNLSMEEIKQIEQRYEEAICETIDTFDPDVIHAQHLWLHSGICAKFNKPLVVTVHGTDLMGIEEARKRASKAMRILKDANASEEEREQAALEAKRALYYADNAHRAAQRAQKILVISHDQQDKLHALYPEVDSKVELLENGYNPDIFYPKKGVDRQEVLGSLKAINTKDGVIPTDYDNMALFVGKFAKFKGIDFILDSASEYEQRATDEGKKAITVIVGDGEQREALLKQAQDLGLKNTYFVGRQNHDVIRNLQALADVSLVPSREEPFGLVVIEATACGNPVIGTNSGGIPDILNTTGRTIKNDYNSHLDAKEKTVVAPDKGTTGTYTTDLGILIPYTRLEVPGQKGKYVEDRDATVQALTDSVMDIFDKRKTFDSSHIASYTKSHYDQNVINDRLIGYFEEAIKTKRQESSAPERNKKTITHTVSRRTIS